jgi:hypothetical protein
MEMTLLKRIGLMLPVLRKTQACEVCGESFACELSLSKGCWCGEVKLSDATRQDLRGRYSGCLCRACLEKAEGDSATPAGQKEV